MDFFKILILFIILYGTTVFSFSKKHETIKKDNFVFLKAYNSECIADIQSKIKVILNIDDIKLSKQIFINSQYLDIRNRQGIYKRFLLHDCNSGCCISYVNDKNSVIKSEKLQRCHCIKGEF
jgi:uncharacterized protein YlbG (UPF0298 family)